MGGGGGGGGGGRDKGGGWGVDEMKGVVGSGWQGDGDGGKG